MSFLPFLVVLLVTGVPFRQAPALPVTFRLAGGLRLTVQGHSAIVANAQGVVVAQNDHLIRQLDDNGNCPSEGFRTVAVKGNFFTIEQQNCGGWFFIDEYLTFRYVPATGKIQLHKFGQSFIDRRDPNKELPDKVLTEKQFGRRYFDQVDTEALYSLP